MGLARRAARLAVVLGRMRNKRARLQALDAADGGSRWGEAVKETLCELGPLFVKLGQNLANRPDLVNEELMEELTKLQDRVPPFNSSLAYKIIEEETGRVIEETFSEISEEPIASASIGPNTTRSPTERETPTAAPRIRFGDAFSSSRAHTITNAADAVTYPVEWHEGVARASQTVV